MPRFITIMVPDDPSQPAQIVARVPPPIIVDPPIFGLAHYGEDRSTVVLPTTGHVVPVAKPGEGLFTYIRRVAENIGINPDIAGSIQQNPSYYDIARSDDPLLNIAVQVDAFANAPAYGLGSAGAPPVAAGPGDPHPGTGGLDPVEPGGENVYMGACVADSVNTRWTPLAPQQVGYILAEEDGLANVVCNNAGVRLYGGIGFPPGVATWEDLKGTPARKDTVEVPIKAGQHFCYAHDGGAYGQKADVRVCIRKV